MDILAAMRVFQKVASTLSLTEAGGLLGLAPSSVSRQIDALEERLGVKLLTRTTRRLSLTEAGAAYKAQVDNLLAELDAVNENIAAFGNEPRGRLKVSLELSLTDDYVDLVETDTDVVIRIGALGDSSLVSRALGRYRRVLVCTPSYLEGCEAPKYPADLERHNCVRYRRSGERVVWQFVRPDTEETIEHAPQGDLVANDVEVLLGAAESGLGIAMLPYWLVREPLEAGALVQLLPDYPIASTLQAAGIHFVYSPNRRQSRKVHAFMDHVSNRVGHLLA